MAEDVIKEFLIDCHENLDRLDVDLVELEKDPRDSKRLAAAFRTIHTIKGASGFLAYRRLEGVTHAGESLLAKMREGTLVLNREIATALLRLIDAVREILAHLEETGTEPETSYDALIAEFTRLQDPVAAAANGQTDTPAGAPVRLATEPAKPSESKPAGATEPAIDEWKELERRDGGDRRSEDRRAAVETALRVDVGVLDRLMILVGELVLARNQILQCTAAHAETTLSAATQRLDLVTSELQEGVMKTRMQPIGQLWSKFPRVVRDVANDCGKQVRLELDGAETELDRTILEAIKDPLTHIIRNAVDHGIEAPAVRQAQGKPAEGHLSLRAYHEGGQVNITIADDGGGIDPEKIRAAAVRRGLVTAERAARMNDHEALRLIFEPGFSTAESVSHLSGRGVGMDVVRTNIEKIGGHVEIQSRVGAGTLVRITIPLTLAIIPALIVAGADGQRFAIPQVSLLELLRVDQTSMPIEHVKDAPFYRLRGRLLPLIYLERELRLGGGTRAEADASNIVVIEANGTRLGLVVSVIHDTEEIVVKPLSRILKSVPVFAGATIMGDGGVALILDVLALAQRARIASADRDRRSENEPAAAVAPTAGAVEHTLLLFAVGDHPRMAIPLSQVARLEEFAADAIERAGEHDVVQYRGQILRLVTLFPTTAASGVASRRAIVLKAGGGDVALAVDHIIDIVTERVAVQHGLSAAGISGSAIVQQHVTEILDVDAVIASARPRESKGVAA
jgi:two-component system, chemotaxis family, sensor kinase CheA